MQKIKSVFNPDSYDTTAFASLSSAMLVCFIGGAALISFSLTTIGFVFMSVGLAMSMFIWSVFFADYYQD